MKTIKLFALSAIILFANLNTYAQNSDNKKEVPIIKKEGVVLGNGGGANRAPILTPEVYIDDYTLIFDTSFEGLSVELLQDDEVVYSGIIDENGEVVLPDYLVGEYELRFYLGSIIFVGEIEL